MILVVHGGMTSVHTAAVDDAVARAEQRFGRVKTEKIVISQHRCVEAACTDGFISTQTAISYSTKLNSMLSRSIFT